MKVFISHSSKDKRFVRTLKECLTENNIETWFDEDQLDLGDSLVLKLEKALATSSHLVVILSPSAVQSEWVTFELRKALSNNRTGLMNKIIPIKYRECKIPDELTDLLYHDLSDEVVLPEGDKLKFISDGYDSFFLKLVRAIRNSEKAINNSEKGEIIKSIKSTEKDIEKLTKLIHRGNYKLIGYSSLEARLKYQRLIERKLGNEIDLEDIRPFLLPAGVKQILKLEIGDRIEFESDLFSDSYGHFAGYRLDDLSIAVDKRIRNEIFIYALRYYQIEIAPEERVIKFVAEIKTNGNPI